MSAEIRCDRCGQATKRFLDAALSVKRGTYASIYSEISPATRGLPWKRSWHLCEPCFQALRHWAEPPGAQCEKYDELEARAERAEEALREVLEWPLPNRCSDGSIATVETYALPEWLARKARDVLASGAGAAAAEETP